MIFHFVAFVQVFAKTGAIEQKTSYDATQLQVGRQRQEEACAQRGRSSCPLPLCTCPPSLPTAESKSHFKALDRGAGELLLFQGRPGA